MDINALRTINNQLLGLIKKKEKLEQALAKRTAGTKYYNVGGPVVVTELNLTDYIATQEAALTTKIQNTIASLGNQISNYVITTVSFGDAPIIVDDSNDNVAKEISNLFKLYDERTAAIDCLNYGLSYLSDQGSYPELSEANLDISDLLTQNRTDLLAILTTNRNELASLLTSYNISNNN